MNAFNVNVSPAPGLSVYTAIQTFVFIGTSNDASKLKEAHEWCQKEVETRMMDHQNNPQYYPEIVVSNTFTQEWEMQPYYDLAKEFGYKVFSIVVENRHDGVNVHNVPEDKLEIMRGRFEIKL